MYKLYKDNVFILASDDDFAILKYVHKNHSYSLSHAVMYEGYKVMLDKKDISKTYVLI